MSARRAACGEERPEIRILIYELLSVWRGRTRRAPSGRLSEPSAFEGHASGFDTVAVKLAAGSTGAWQFGLGDLMSLRHTKIGFAALSIERARLIVITALGRGDDEQCHAPRIFGRSSLQRR